jgi:hypothetical protein
VDRLLVGERHDREQDHDGDGDRQDEGQGGRPSRRQDDEDLLRRVAVEDSASEEKTASPTALPMAW